MKIERITFGEYRANSYLVCEGNKAILIDASLSVEKLESALNKNRVELEYIFITHSHFDHMLNLQEIVDKYKVNVYVHKKGLINMQDQHKNMSDVSDLPFAININEFFKGVENGVKIDCLENKFVECYETPGHCESSICFKIDDVLFTGDTLFYGTCGRCDLWDSSTKYMKNSLKAIGEIGGVQTYYPGHGYSMNAEAAKKTIDYCLNSILI